MGKGNFLNGSLWMWPLGKYTKMYFFDLDKWSQNNLFDYVQCSYQSVFPKYIVVWNPSTDYQKKVLKIINYEL